MTHEADKTMTVSRYRDQPCLYCGVNTDAATGTTRDAIMPKEGDIMVCIHCACFMVMTKDIRLRKPTISEVYEIARDHTVLRAQAAVRQLNEDITHGKHKDDCS